jgi:heme exporter protein B
VAVLLASLVALNRLFVDDYADGALEQLMLTPQPVYLIVLGKVLAQWLLFAIPLALMSPLLAVQFVLPGSSGLVLGLSVLLGTPVVLLIGSIGAALTVGLRGASTLMSLVVVPLYVPTLVFGAGALEAVVEGGNPDPHLRLLAAMLIFAIIFAPPAAAAALRIALEY